MTDAKCKQQESKHESDGAKTIANTILKLIYSSMITTTSTFEVFPTGVGISVVFTFGGFLIIPGIVVVLKVL